MPVLRGCLCWKSIKTGCIATAIYSITISCMQILLQLALWTGNRASEQMVLEAQYMVYIPLAALDLLLIVFSVLMLLGLEKENSGRHLLLPWLGLSTVYIIYECTINVYFFYVAFSVTTVPGVVMTNVVQPMPLNTAWGTDILPELIVLVIYWGLKLLVYILAIVCVFSYYRELSSISNKYKSALGERPFQYPGGGYYNNMTRNEPAFVHPGHFPEDDPYRNRPQEYDARERDCFYGIDANRNGNTNDRFYRLDPNLLQSREDISRMYTDASRRLPGNQYYGRDDSVPYNEFGYGNNERSYFY